MWPFPVVGATRGATVRGMEIILVLLGLALLLAGPLAYFRGKDSRRVDDHGWFGSHSPS